MDTYQLLAYRQLGLTQFQQLLLNLPEKASETDYFVDRVIRNLSNLPSRPETVLPYVGLYGAKLDLDEYREYRDVAASRLFELVMRLPSMHEVDAEIDKYIRVLSNLPERGLAVEPYVRLFVLRSLNDQPDALQIAQDFSATQQFVTAEQLIQIAGTNELESRIRALTLGMNATLAKFNINTNQRISPFLVQVMHESGVPLALRNLGTD
ncbi:MULTISPECIES: hypothetical protein [Trichocoleus]|uniref:Uncharacterized protein n=1 Tax=Trichocoleus desertorum GB2-A4 TaxID=2933944 RepID=A0ABV0JDY4_9CYAN|nr:hypothetical protein [Trichocoleus sp. FACHB-46]MBD1865158.1 hypothetical protein [Trichocoleus sp. FACHB-46]